jgi:hypothetical protein
MLKSHKTGHPSKPANFLGPSSGRFREVSLYIFNPFRQKRSGVDCDVIVKNVKAHLTVGKY